MSVKKSKGNMYRFVTHTWNPIRGKCPYACSYCYVGRWGQKQNPLNLDKKELRVDLGKDNFIFVCSGCDIFAPEVPWEWIAEIFQRAREFPQNAFLWHTKNPVRALEIPFFQYPARSTLCVTVETDIHMGYISAAPAPIDRINALKQWKGEKMITIEPLMNFNLDRFSQMILEAAPTQVNIGADSGHNALPEPSPEKVRELIEILRPHTRVHLKKNLSRIFKE